MASLQVGGLGTMDRSTMRLAGCAGVGVGACILSSAIAGDVTGTLFAGEVLRGATAEAWVARVAASPGVARFVTVGPIFGFSLMLVVAISLYRLIGDRHWASTLGIVAFLVGIPFIVAAFVARTSLAWTLLDSGTSLSVDAMLLVTSEIRQFELVNTTFGPLFCILMGNPLMALAAWRTSILPRWLFGWALFNALVMSFGIASLWVPQFGIGQLGGPLTMLWFVTTGIVLLKRSAAKETAAMS